MAIQKNELLEILQNKFPNGDIKITDTVGDEDHYLIEIIDDIFAGKSKIEQHKIVHLALESILHTRLHAIELKTKS